MRVTAVLITLLLTLNSYLPNPKEHRKKPCKDVWKNSFA